MLNITEEEIIKDWEIYDINNPAVSIICNAYNHEEYITQALDGFIRQKTKYGYEILIHDDASTDGTAEIIKEYQVKYPHIVKPVIQTENQYSKGYEITLKYQIPRAKGKYLAFCEGDDYWCDDRKIEQQVSFLEQNYEYSGCVHNSKVIDNDGKYIRKFFSEESDEDYDIITLDSLLTFPHFTSYVFRNPWIENGLEYLTKHISGWDKSYAIYMIKCGKVRYFNKFMSCYRYVNDRGTSTQARLKKNNLTEMIVDSQLSLYNQIKAYGLKINMMDHYFRQACNYSINKFMENPSKDNFKKLIYAFRKCPYKNYTWFFYVVKKIITKPFRIVKNRIKKK